MCPARGKSANRATEHFGGPTEKEGFRVEAKTDSHDPERTYSLALLPSSEPAAARGGGNQPLHPWLMPGRTDADPTQGPGEDGARWGRRKTPKQEGGWEDGHLLEQASLRTGHPQSQHPYGASSKPASIRDILKASIHMASFLHSGKTGGVVLCPASPQHTPIAKCSHTCRLSVAWTCPWKGPFKPAAELGVHQPASDRRGSAEGVAGRKPGASRPAFPYLWQRITGRRVTPGGTKGRLPQTPEPAEPATREPRPLGDRWGRRA